MKDFTQEIGEYTVTTDRSRLMVTDIHDWLCTEAYWCTGIPFETVKTAFDNSFVSGVLHAGRQIGYARLITDYATFGYLADVFITAPHRGKGLSKALLELMLKQPWVGSLRNILLATQDAHSLYEQFGFKPPSHPERLMQILLPNPYTVNATEL